MTKDVTILNLAFDKLVHLRFKSYCSDRAFGKAFPTFDAVIWFADDFFDASSIRPIKDSVITGTLAKTTLYALFFIDGNDVGVF